MEIKTERAAHTVKSFWRIPLIRHVRAVLELIIMFFWRNYFGKGEYAFPCKREVEYIYDIWAGHEKERRFYIYKDMYRT